MDFVDNRFPSRPCLPKFPSVETFLHNHSFHTIFRELCVEKICIRLFTKFSPKQRFPSLNSCEKHFPEFSPHISTISPVSFPQPAIPVNWLCDAEKSPIPTNPRPLLLLLYRILFYSFYPLTEYRSAYSSCKSRLKNTESSVTHITHCV